MDKKQREDAINEVIIIILISMIGPRTQSDETPVHYHL